MEAGQYFLTSPKLALEEQGKIKSPTFRLWHAPQIQNGAALGSCPCFRFKGREPFANVKGSLEIEMKNRSALGTHD